MSYARAALEALRARFTPAELQAIAAQPWPDVLRDMRQRRAEALVASRWVETPESERETAPIRALDAFVHEMEARQ